MSTRTGWTAIAALLAGLAAFLVARGTVRPRVEPSRADGSGAAPTAPPSLAAGGLKPRTAKTVSAQLPARLVADASAPLPPAVEEALTALWAAADAPEGTPTGLGSLIAALARAVCVEGDVWRGVLSRVVARESRLGRGGIAAVLALGRCGREEVLRGLAALVADPSTRRDLEGALAVSLGQVRNPEGTSQDGGTGRAWLGIGDATLGAPIPEAYVVDALLQLMSSGPPERGRTPKGMEEDPRLSAVQALAGTAGVRQDVFDQLLSIASTDADVDPWLRSSLSAAGQAPWVAAWAKKKVVASGDDDLRLRERTMAWIAASPEEAAREITALLLDATVSPQRKARVLSGTHVGVGVAESTVEELLRAADAFATAHPTVVIGWERSGMAQNTPLQEIQLDVRWNADSLILNAASGPRGGSTVVRDFALEAALRTLRREDPDGGRIRPPRLLAFVFERGEALTLLVLARLPGAGLDPERLADCLDAALESPAARGVAAASIRAAIARAMETLPSDVRAALETRRKARADAAAGSKPAGR